MTTSTDSTASAWVRDALTKLDEQCHALKVQVFREFGAGSPELRAVYKATKPLCDLASRHGALADARERTHVRWHYGPTESNPDPGRMWCYDCGGEVWFIEDAYICTGCKRTGTDDD